MYSPSWSSPSSDSNHNKRIALYLRVSTTEQMTEGYGLESQEQSIRAYAENRIPRRKDQRLQRKPYRIRDTETRARQTSLRGKKKTIRCGHCLEN